MPAPEKPHRVQDEADVQEVQQEDSAGQIATGTTLPQRPGDALSQRALEKRGAPARGDLDLDQLPEGVALV